MIGRYGLGSQTVLGKRDEQRVEGFLVFKNAEGDVEEFAHDGAADSEGMEFSAFQNCDPRL